jgi:hypothetical protein
MPAYQDLRTNIARRAGSPNTESSKHSRRRVSSFAALLNTVVNAALFPEAPDALPSSLIGVLHGQNGIVPMFIDRMLLLGVTSVRTARMTASQLCSHLLHSPWLTKFYIEQVHF